jgi:PIN domain nuclease of toxin-antitoxin system
MKLLIDTHVFLWLRNSPDKIPNKVFQLYQNISHEVFLSMASIWEMQIKSQLG